VTGQGRGEIRRLLDHYGLRPRKRLGQHFLADPNVVERIVRTAAVGSQDQVVEIGAGTGTLTKALAATGARVVAYEIDEGLRPLLESVLEDTGVDLRFADAARVDLAEQLGAGEWVMVANLPYGVGTTLLLDALQEVPAIERFVVMVQREVAERLAASPGSKIYGLASVVAALHAEVHYGFTVAPSVFVPPPEVESAVIVVRRVEADSGAREASRIAAAAFNQRRKMVRRSLQSVFDDPVAVLGAAGIDPTVRAEDLAPEDYLRLAAVAR
jgi:16S rRNA (adenine1518-N6/adenine1519-N6)-dimethyltransferase